MWLWIKISGKALLAVRVEVSTIEEVRLPLVGYRHSSQMCVVWLCPVHVTCGELSWGNSLPMTAPESDVFVTVFDIVRSDHL